jgi:hypothetical protein
MGTLCSEGSTEYVRFYLSYDEGTTWTDLGLEQFQVHDIPTRFTNGQRLEFAVGKTIETKVAVCLSEKPFALVRAILSWNQPPPSNSPNWVPPWGNVRNAHIQLPMRRLNLGAVLEFTKLEFPKPLLPYLDLEADIAIANAKTLSAAQLSTEYRGKEVPPHRFAMSEAKAILAGKAGSFVLAPSLEGAILGKLPFDLSDVFNPLGDLKFNTQYEELQCVGYDPVKDELTAVLRVKLPNGYSGRPCSPGSLEWVAFYADLDRNGSFETHLGTSTVRVHDFQSIPSGGLAYAVVLPARLLRLRQDCHKGPKLIPIRAVLSWNHDPTPDGPNAIPHWGNREDTLIQIPKGRPFVHDREPFLFTVSTVSTDLINNATGKAVGDRPFGGYLTFGGVVSNAVPLMKYRLQVKPAGASDTSYVPLTTAVQLSVAEFGPGGFTITHPTLTNVGPASEGYFKWEEYGNRFVDGHLIGLWPTGALEHGKRYDVCLFLSTDGNPAHDIASNVVTVLIDNKEPDAQLSLTLAPGTECLHVDIGGSITGSFTATDEHFSEYVFTLEPSHAAHGAHPIPSAGYSIYHSVSPSPDIQTGIADPGVSQGFTLNTTGMSPCGYALILDVYDRTIVNGGTTVNKARASAGFCLE